MKWFTKYQESIRRVYPEVTGMQLITPIEPSERSGGGKAVKELLELFSKNFSIRLIVLQSIVKSFARIEKKIAEIISGLPVLNTSAQSLFGGGAVERTLVPGIPVFF